jgi:hypothetical protein
MNTDEPRRIGRKSLPVDRRAARIAAAEQSLASAYAGMRAAGVDPDSIAAAFAVARDCLAEARELSAQARRELALAQYERDLVSRRASASSPPAGVPYPAAGAVPAPGGSPEDPAVGPLVTPGAAGRDLAMALAARATIPGLPGTDACPDPGAARTPEEFMDALRGFRAWAGKPSFRAMERQCARRFAASTLCTALRADALPSLEMVHAIVTGCGGSPRHIHAFATAWRGLSLPGHAVPGQGASARQDPRHWRDRSRGLYSVGGAGPRAVLPGTAPSAKGEAVDEGRAPREALPPRPPVIASPAARPGWLSPGHRPGRPVRRGRRSRSGHWRR